MGALEVEALALWRAWFKESGNNPWVEDDYGRSRCFFCVGDYPDHDPDCIFEHARRMIADVESGAPVMDTFTLLDPKTVRVVQYQGGAAIALDVPLAALIKFVFNLPLSVFEDDFRRMLDHASAQRPVNDPFLFC